MAMRNQFNWDAGRGGFDGVPQIDGSREPLVPQVVFVVPGKRPEDDRAAPPGFSGAPLALPPPAAPPMDTELRKGQDGTWRSGRTE
jgi:hypothetical protein